MLRALRLAKSHIPKPKNGKMRFSAFVALFLFCFPIILISTFHTYADADDYDEICKIRVTGSVISSSSPV